MGEHSVSKGMLYLFMVGLLITGTSNTLVTKYQNVTVSAGHVYHHPFLQCFFMFIGEFLCLAIFKIKEARS